MLHFNLLAFGLILVHSTSWALEGTPEATPAPAPAAAEVSVDNAATTTKKTTWEVKDVAASQQWVTDRLEAPLRSCPSDRCKVVKVVKPGFEATLIGLTNDGWALVVSGETKGFLPKRYLQTTPVASQQLEGVQKQSIAAIQANGALKSEMDTLMQRAQQAETELSNFRKNNFELKQELDYVKSVSAQTLVINEENRQMKAELETLRQRNDLLEQQANDVEGKNQRAWIMVGAGILFFGWVIGRFARAPRRKGWNDI